MKVLRIAAIVSVAAFSLIYIDASAADAREGGHRRSHHKQRHSSKRSSIPWYQPKPADPAPTPPPASPEPTPAPNPASTPAPAPAPTPTPPPPPPAQNPEVTTELGLGINYNYEGPEAVASKDIPALRSIFSNIRLLVARYTSANVLANQRAWAKIALANNYNKVLYGLGADDIKITSGNLSAYHDAVMAEAAKAAAFNDPRLELQIGNEEELHHDSSVTDAQVRDHIRDMAADVKAAHPNLKISYASSITYKGVNGHDDSLASWESEGIGKLDRISFNIYEARSTFAKHVTYISTHFGGKAFVGEWGTNNGYSDFNNEANYAIEIDARRDLLRDSSISDYYHYHFMGPDNSRWGLKGTDGHYRDAYNALSE